MFVVKKVLFEYWNVSDFSNRPSFNDFNDELLYVVDDTQLKIAPLSSGRMQAAISECKQFHLSGRKKPRRKWVTGRIRGKLQDRCQN